MSCWRVEDEDQVGPYNGGILGFGVHKDPNHPACSGGACALIDPWRLFVWFAGYWPKLAERGQNIVEITSTDGELATQKDYYSYDPTGYGQVTFVGKQTRRPAHMWELLDDFLGEVAAL